VKRLSTINRKIIKDYFLGCKDFDNLILKGHLLIEHKINDTIKSLSLQKIDISKSDFKFIHKVQILKILGLFMIDEKFPSSTKLYENIILLNKLRNSMAHNLKFDETILENFMNNFKITDAISYQESDFRIKKNKEEPFIISKQQLRFVTCISIIYLLLSVYPDIILFKRKNPKVPYKNVKLKYSFSF
jgi:hypothetical protein